LALADALDAFLDDRIGSAELDQIVQRHSAPTDDATVATIGTAIWFLYDDFKDHRVALDRNSWDWAQRLLLVLRSGATVEHVRTNWTWSKCQVLPACAGILALVLIALTWWSAVSTVVVIAAGFTSIGFSMHWRAQHEVAGLPSVAPFSNFANLMSARRIAHGFRKRRYRPELAHRSIRSKRADFLLMIPSRVIWLALGPIVLLAQALPTSTAEHRVVVPSVPHEAL